MALTTLYVQRHGLKDPNGGENAQLMPEGRAQIAQAAMRYLTGVHVDALFSSTLDRTEETAQIAYAAIMNSQHEKMVDQREGIGFMHGLPLEEYGEGMKHAKAMLEEGTVPTLAQWRQWVPKYMEAAIPRFTTALQDVAIEMVDEHGNDSVAFIGCHSPLTELAVPEKDFHLVPAFQEAGIMAYQFEVEGGAARLVHYGVIFGGFMS